MQFTNFIVFDAFSTQPKVSSYKDDTYKGLVGENLKKSVLEMKSGIIHLLFLIHSKYISR
ncbi:MAG: hypothetical protein CSA03_01920 [Bacteroidetes bacterium]|nr:MAG: hypothetical protein CSA03_01920 [Bacteroidota bacterium]